MNEDISTRVSIVRNFTQAGIMIAIFIAGVAGYWYFNRILPPANYEEAIIYCAKFDANYCPEKYCVFDCVPNASPDAVGGCIGGCVPKPIEQQQIVCTEEARQCPDGSYVGRGGSNCEFRECPEVANLSGKVKGKVSIGPLCPVEPCPSQVINPYVSRQLVFTPKGGGRPVDLPFYVPLQNNGSFESELPYSNYEVTLTNCNFLGCGYSLPKKVFVPAGKTIELYIDIDTGIR